MTSALIGLPPVPRGHPLGSMRRHTLFSIPSMLTVESRERVSFTH